MVSMGQIGPFISYHFNKSFISQPGVIELESEERGDRLFLPFQEDRVMIKDHIRRSLDSMRGKENK